MEILESEENQFKYKLMNVFFQYFKNALSLVFIGYQGIQMLKMNSECSFSEVTYLSTLYNGGLALLLFNLISAAYILYQKHFVRIEYFIAYGLNLIWYLSMMLFSAQQLIQGSCELGQMTTRYFIILSTVNQLDIILIMMFKHSLSNRQVNIPSNIAVVVLTLTKPFSIDCAINAISLEIMLVAANLISLVSFSSLNFTLYLFPKLKDQIQNAFKFIVVLVLCFIILNYLLIVYYVQSGDVIEKSSCISLDFITRTYCYLAPVTLLGVFPIMASFNYQAIDDDEDKDEDVIALQSNRVAQSNVHNAFQQSRITLTPSPYTPYKIMLNSPAVFYLQYLIAIIVIIVILVIIWFLNYILYLLNKLKYFILILLRQLFQLIYQNKLI